jgi:hypothetical protein
VLESIWAVVEAVNSYDEFIVEYPVSEPNWRRLVNFRMWAKSNLSTVQVPLTVCISGYQSLQRKMPTWLVADEGLFCGCKGKCGVEFWNNPLDYPVHLWTVLHLREASCTID